MGDFTKLGMYRHSAPPAHPRARKEAEKALASQEVIDAATEVARVLTGGQPWGPRSPHSNPSGHRKHIRAGQ